MFVPFCRQIDVKASRVSLSPHQADRLFFFPQEFSKNLLVSPSPNSHPSLWKKCSYSSVLWFNPFLPSQGHQGYLQELPRKKPNKLLPWNAGNCSIKQVANFFQGQRYPFSKRSEFPCDLHQILQKSCVCPVLLEQQILHGSAHTLPYSLPFLPYQE